ncbi:hypothetical protein F4680DRAFT_143547 [Xylaria scruposa]|nr:hypothetical protein F4680DRAFT_143547 [Xylaria scruposa]
MPIDVRWQRSQVSYMNFLESVFGELGISQYLGVFIDQGFDSWETILDITESDLDALGVKLGHRRVGHSGPPFIAPVSLANSIKKLQRRIANYRGVAPDVSLVSPTRTSIEDSRHDSNRTDIGRADTKVGPTVAKRKYRRHPKPDEHAPERPPSAYVLFSNSRRLPIVGEMRDDLKGQNLTFTEIAKLVGENWQNLGRTEKEPFERQANEAKEKYNHDLAEYKKTAECRKYNEYLREFRKRQAVQTQDAAKRLKTDAESTRGSSTSGASIGPGGATSGTGSGSESQQGSEPPPSRQQRLGSMASLSNGTGHLDDSMTSPILSIHEESNHGRRRMASPHSHDVPIHSANHRIGWTDSQSLPGDSTGSGTPWLDARILPQNISRSPEIGVLGIHPGQRTHTNTLSRGSGSSASTSFSQPPSLKHEPSSHGSLSSSTPPNLPRTPSDASLPIHALLSSKPEPPPPYIQAAQPSILNGQVPQIPSLHSTQHVRPPGGFHGSPHYSNRSPELPPGHRVGHLGKAIGISHEDMTSLPHETGSAAAARLAGSSESGLDGISALLRAREIVDRRR